MTLLATSLSPLLTPLLVEQLGGELLPIPFWPMMQTMSLTVVLPLALGMILRPFLGEQTKQAERIAPAIAALAIVIICSHAVAANAERIAHLSIWLLLLVVVLNGLGYMLGWAVGSIFGFDMSYKITMSIEIGMQNAGLGVALALKHFAPETALPGALFAVWCILTAAGMTHVLNKQRISINPAI